MRRGEVWWYEPPHEKPRPTLILTCDELIASIFDVIAVPATTNIRGAPTEVQIGVSDGMPAECVLVLANTFSAEKAYATKRITILSSERMHEVCHALNAATSC